LVDVEPKAISLLARMYDAPPFTPPPLNKYNLAIQKAVKNVQLDGVEFWQANLIMDKEGAKTVIVESFLLMTSQPVMFPCRGLAREIFPVEDDG